MAANIVANVFISGSLTVNNQLTASYANTFSSPFFLSDVPSFTIFNGSVGLGITPTTQQLDLSSDDARKLLTSTWTTGSDCRIKLDIQTANVARCAEIVDSLDLKYFEWKSETDDKHSLGWIAQDVQGFFPKSVTPDSLGVLMLNSDQLIKVLYGALKKTQYDFFHSR